MTREWPLLLNHVQSQWRDRKGVRAVRETRDGRAMKVKTKEDSELPGVWVAYGTLLQHLRKRAGLNQQALGEAIGHSLEQVVSVEQGRRAAKETFTVAAERVLAADGVLEVLIESEVLSRFSYDPLLVPGLLQTEAYARAVFAGHCPPFSEEIVDQHTEARLGRQKLLTRDPMAELSFIIGEEALRNLVGGVEVVRGQWQQLLEVSTLRDVEVQVMSTGGGFHAGLDGPFVLVETSDLRRLGYIEAQEIGCIVSDPTDVSGFGLRYGKLRSQSRNAQESARLIEQLVGET